MTNSAEGIMYPAIDSSMVDREGNIYYSGLGAIPKRDVPEMGSFIKDGSSSLY